MAASRIVGIGVDIESIQRFRNKPLVKNEKFYRRLFTPVEIEYCKTKKDPYPHFTARFCAKEALKKALPETLSPGWQNVEIRNDEKGRPSVHFLPVSQSSSEHSALDKYGVQISLSHDNARAIAFVIIENI
ncbi:unnamed protein product [marine sediment metagenome]|uniref:4'-phosphopantetheinyl transferase domain-containing protein n=1 Tax=marine sediment metagenome TaxID=412755 RepID=X0VAG3_9ZZZZ